VIPKKNNRGNHPWPKTKTPSTLSAMMIDTTKDCTTIVTNMRNMRNMRNELGGEEEGGEGGTHCHHP
jgi:hypothetical protein